MRRALPYLATLFCGLAVGWVCAAPPKRQPPPPPDFSGPLTLVPVSRLSDARGEYRPFYVSVDGAGRPVNSPLQPSEEEWIVHLDGGRIRVHAVRVR
jgi:hypothetical protein